jgi:hypothetical protein
VPRHQEWDRVGRFVPLLRNILRPAIYQEGTREKRYRDATQSPRVIGYIVQDRATKRASWPLIPAGDCATISVIGHYLSRTCVRWNGPVLLPAGCALLRRRAFRRDPVRRSAVACLFNAD